MRRVMMGFIVGMLLVCVSAGAVWQDSHEFIDVGYVNCIFARSDSFVVVGMSSGKVFKWDGTVWTEMDSPTTWPIDNILVTEDNVILMHCNHYFYWHENGSWRNKTLQPAYDEFTGISGTSRQNMIIHDELKVYKYEDGAFHQYFHIGYQGVDCPLITDAFSFDGVTVYWNASRIEITGYWGSGGQWFEDYYEVDSECYVYNGEDAGSFFGESVGEGSIFFPHSPECIYLTNDGGGLDSNGRRVIRYNGEFFTDMATRCHRSDMGYTHNADTLLFVCDDRVHVWDGLIRYELPPLPNNLTPYDSIHGLSKADFWVSGYNSIHHWVGPVPEVPAETGAFMKLHDYRIHTGEDFHLELAACNATNSTLTGDVYCCMMLFGTNGLWFWPNWTKDPAQIDPVSVTLEPNSIEYFDVLNFTWLDLDFQVDGLFHSIMVKENGDLTEFQSVGFSIR